MLQSIGLKTLRRGTPWMAVASNRVYSEMPRTAASPAPAMRWPSVDFRQTHSATSPTPITIQFPTLALPDWKVTDSLTVSLEQEMDGSWVASDTTFLVYGDGPTAENALADYLTSLVDFFELVQARASRSLEDQVRWEQLKQAVKPVKFP